MRRYKSYFESIDQDYLTLYHGTHSKKVNDIKNKGLIPDNSSLYIPAWFMLSTTKPSAIFHANYSPEEGMFPYLITFKIPKTQDERFIKMGWEGNPYLWKKEKIGVNKKSYWYALMQPIPKEFIYKIEKINLSLFQKIKNKEVDW